MKKKLLWLLIIVTHFNDFFSQSPTWEWAKEVSTSAAEIAYDVISDVSGNIIIGGSFSGNLSSVYGPSVTTSSGGNDGFFAKYDSNSNLIWASKIGGPGDDEVISVGTDASGNIYVAGNFNGVCDFDPSPASNTLSTATQDGFVAKYSSTGSFIWVVNVSSSGTDKINKMIVDANGIFITGLSPSFVTLTSTNLITKISPPFQGGVSDFFGAKYNFAGVAQWVVSGGSNKMEQGTDVISDNSNVYFVGTYEKQMDFFNALGLFSAGTLDVEQNNLTSSFITSYSQSGALNWSNNVTATNSSQDNATINGITQDASNLYICGSFYGTAKFKYPTPAFTKTSSGGNDIFLAKLNKSGVFQGVSSQTGSNTGEEFGYGIKKDPLGNVVMSGYFLNTLNFSSFSGPPSITSSGNEDVFISSFTPSLTLNWILKAGGTQTDRPYGLYVDNTGTITVSGNQGGSSFGATVLTGGSLSNIFVAKITCVPLGNNTITATQTICTGSAPAALSGSTPTGGGTYNYVWEQSPDNATWLSATGTFTNQNYSPPSLTATTYYRRTVIASGACIDTLRSSSVLISITPSPTTSNAGTAQTVCSANATLNGNVPTTGTGAWTVLTGTATVTTPSSATSGITGLSNGINRFVWTITNGTCPASSSTVTITRDIPPTISNAGTAQTVCSANATLNGNVPTTGTGAWTVLTGTATVTTPSSATSGITGLSNGINRFVWTITNGTCPASSSTVTITRDINPTISNAGTAQTVCSANATLNGNVPTTGTGAWTVLTGTATVTTPSSATSGITGLSNGINRFVWTITNGTCPASSSTVTITRDINPTTSNAGTAQTVCSANATLNGNVPTTGTGAWTVLTGTATVTTPSSATSGITGLSNGINRFVWTITNGTCPASSSTVTITRDINPTTSNAGTAQTVCSANATLNGNVPTTGTGAWTVLTGTATVTTPSSATSGITGLSNGINRFVWTITNGTCPASSSTVTITRDIPPTTSNAGTAQTVCSANTILNGNVPTTGTGAWTVLTGAATVTTPSSATSGITGLSNGINRFIWTITNGTCPASSSTVTITRDIPPTTSNAGTAQTVCSANATLNGNVPTTGTGAWTVGTGIATVTTPSSATSGVTGLSNGTNNFVWTITNGTCPASSSTVTITRDILPTTSNAGTAQTLCSANATLNGNLPTTGTGAWTVGTGTATISSPGSSATNVIGLSNGTNNFVWTITNGTCPSSSSTVTITRDIPPSSSNAGTPQTVCTTTTNLGASSPAIGTGLWTVITGLGTVTTPGSATSAVSGLSNGNNQFVWTISNGSCPSTSSTVTVTKNIAPSIALVGANQTICTSTTNLNASPPAIGTGSWTLLSGSGSITSPTSPTSIVSGLSFGINEFLWTVSNGGCPPSTSTLTITRDTPPTTSNAGTAQTVCTPTTVLAANAPSVGTGVWTVFSGSGVVASPGVPTSAVSGLSNGSNQLVWTISNGTCPSSSSTVTITKNIAPSTAVVGINQTICTSTTNLNASPPAIGVGLWTLLSGSGTISTPNSPTALVSGLSFGMNEFLWTVSNGSCPSSTNTLTITRDTPPTASNAGSGQTLCAAATTLNANVPGFGTGVWTVMTGTASISNTTSASTNVTGLSYGVNQFVWTISNGTCPSSSSTVNVTQDKPPTSSVAGTSFTQCPGSASLSGNVPSVGIGSWSVVSGAAAVISPGSAATNVTGLSDGDNDFVWTISNGTCPSSSSTVTVTKNVSPTTPHAGVNQTLCASVATLNANTPLSGTGTWSVMSGPAVITATGSPTTTVNGLNYGNNAFVWTIANGICPSLSDTVVIFRDYLPSVAVTGSDKIICGSTDNISSNTPIIGSGIWSVYSGSGVIANTTSTISSVSNLGTGVNSFIWTITNGSCPPSKDTMRITVDAIPTLADAGKDQNICSDVVNLNGNPAIIGNGTWTLISGSGSFSNANLNTTAVNALGIGSNTFRWTIQNGVCPSSFDEVTITQDIPPSIADAGADQDVESPVAMLSASVPTIGTGSWTVIEGGGILDDASQPQTSITNLIFGNTVIRWTVKNGSCPESKDDIIIQLKSFKIPNGFSPNGDGINDAFVVTGLDYYQGVKFSVFNRWGGVVYENDNYKNEWNGMNLHNEILADDTYYYTLKIPATGMDFSGFIIIKKTK